MSETFKHEAAIKALDEVRSGMVVGLGTGSTVNHFIRGLGDRVRDGLSIATVSTSVASASLARELGIYVTTFAEYRTLDLVVDGADEVSPSLDLIKGLGGALVREKIVAKASRRVVVIVDETKIVDRLGTRAPVPVEIVPFARELVVDQLARLGGRAELREQDGQVFVSDNANHILDWHAGSIADADSIEKRLKALSGVVDSGIFANLADRVIVAGASGLRILDRDPASKRDS